MYTTFMPPTFLCFLLHTSGIMHQRTRSITADIDERASRARCAASVCPQAQGFRTTLHTRVLGTTSVQAAFNRTSYVKNLEGVCEFFHFFLKSSNVPMLSNEPARHINNSRNTRFICTSYIAIISYFEFHVFGKKIREIWKIEKSREKSVEIMGKNSPIRMTHFFAQFFNLPNLFSCTW